MIEIILGIVLVIVSVLIMVAGTYRIVPPTEAHLVTTQSGRFVASSDDSLSINGEQVKKAYFAIPSFVPFFGTQVRVMDVTIKEINLGQETFEKNQARFIVDTSAKYRIKNIKTAAETFSDDKEVEDQLKGVMASSVRDVTSKVDVIEARSNKQAMEDSVKKVMGKNFEAWGLELVNFQVVDLRDTADSKIISNISLRREKEIESDTRQQNAERIRLARVKEAEAEENARQREIERDQRIAEQEQIKNMKISEQQKIAQEKHYEVVRVQEVKQAEITKAKTIIEAEQKRDYENIMKEQKRLEGEGDRLKQEEQAKGEAAPIRERGLAEADALNKKQEALNKFTPQAIQALTAEQVVRKDEAIGVATAKALENADLKVFSGGSSGGAGFDLGQLIASARVADPVASDALVNKVGVPNDMGFSPKSFGAGVETGKKMLLKKE